MNTRIIFITVISAIFVFSICCFKYQPTNAGSNIDYENPANADIPILIHEALTAGFEVQRKAFDSLTVVLSRDDGLDLIIEQLEASDVQNRADTAAFLGWWIRIGKINYKSSNNLVPALITALRDEDLEVRRRTCFALGDIGLIAASNGDLNPFDDLKTKTISAIVDLLSDENNDLRVTAANTLSRIGPQAHDSVNKLKSMLSDTDFLVRIAAAGALAKIDTNAIEAIPVLQDALRADPQLYLDRVQPNVDGEVATNIHYTAAVALGYFGPKAISTIADLMELFKDPMDNLWNVNGFIQTAASRAIISIDPNGEEAIPMLIEFLQNEQSCMREYAATALGLYGSLAKSSLSALRELDSDPNTGVRAAARNAIIEIEDADK